MEMGTQLRQRHYRIDWLAVLDDVEVAGRKIHYAGAILVRNISVANVPLARHDPIQDFGPRRNFIDLEWKVTLEYGDRSGCFISAIALESVVIPVQLAI